MTGLVVITDRPAAPGDQVREGDWIATGANSAAALSRGEQRIELGENARLSFQKAAGKTVIDQQEGRARYNVDKRAQKHFEVRTSNVAAVVKGTTFTVDTTKNEHEVKVEEGVVEVALPSGKRKAILGAGQTARASAEGLSVESSPSDPAPANRELKKGTFLLLTAGVLVLLGIWRAYHIWRRDFAKGR